jgi:hypothetical protein
LLPVGGFGFAFGAGDDFDGNADAGGLIGDEVGVAGSGRRLGARVTWGFASSEGRPSPSADIIPVMVPTATTTEAAATIAPRRTARLRSALRLAAR